MPEYITAAYHPAYGFSGGGHWLAHTIMGSIVHGLVYRAIWSLTRGMSPSEIILLAVVAILAVYAVCRRTGF